MRLTVGTSRPLQRRVVRVLAEMGERTWLWPDFTDILRAWNLPDRREDCRRYTGLPDPA